MHHRHFRQAEHHGDRDEAGDGIADQDRRPGIAKRDAAAEEKAGADGAAQADHDDLAFAQGFVQAAFAGDDRIVFQARAPPAAGYPAGFTLTMDFHGSQRRRMTMR